MSAIGLLLPSVYAAAAAEAAKLQRGILVTLPQDEGDDSPACLDGTEYKFYFVKSETGSTKWTVYIDGGGWCYDEDMCYARTKTSKGTSSGLAATGNCQCANPNKDGTLATDCNCLHLPYCDGASFSGFRRGSWPVPGTNQTVTFRGIRNLDGAIDFAFESGMRNASEFVITGSSAGGLSTFLHTDRVAARLKEQAPNCHTIRSAPGFHCGGGTVGFGVSTRLSATDAAESTNATITCPIVGQYSPICRQ